MSLPLLTTHLRLVGEPAKSGAGRVLRSVVVLQRVRSCTGSHGLERREQHLWKMSVTF